jgi:hypothetical protein
MNENRNFRNLTFNEAFCTCRDERDRLAQQFPDYQLDDDLSFFSCCSRIFLFRKLNIFPLKDFFFFFFFLKNPTAVSNDFLRHTATLSSSKEWSPVQVSNV